MRSVIVMLKEDEHRQRLEEIQSLVTTVEYDVVDLFIQSSKPRARFLIGRGKVEEIRESIKEKGIELVIFENYLNSRQLTSLEEEFGIPVIDKFDLILNVFESHAKNKEAKLQIELVRLKRKIPYLKTFLSRKVAEEHPGFGGSGEFIIHSTMKTIDKRIKKIEELLEKFDRRIENQREVRRKLGKVISLAGYTNVGKTTLLNALTDVSKETSDELFTTLGTKTSSIILNGEKVFINDTIGFIRNLPHELIYTFRATLDDIKNSDLILLVMDASEPEKEFMRKKEICENTLVEINADNIPVLYVLNKIDKIDGVNDNEDILENYVKISAEKKVGLEELKNAVEESLRDGSDK